MKPILHSSGQWKTPSNSTDAQVFAYVRTEVISLCKDLAISAAGVRYPEKTVRGANKEGFRMRLRLEGVVVEAIGSAGVPVRVGPLQQISIRLASASAKTYLDASEVRGLDWTDKGTEEREAILTAISALEK